MTTTPGWHPDPAPATPGRPPVLRYWDGGRWTEHTAPYPQASLGPTSSQQATTPDGVPLASWWHRAGADLVDALILLPITAVLYIPFYPRLAHVFSDYLDQIEEATRTGAKAPSSIRLQETLLPTLALMTVVGLAFSLLWTVAWLRLKQATPGKLATGLRVRRREGPGRLPYGVIVRRWGAQYGLSVVALVPVVGNVFSLYALIDVLWAAWDGQRQTLHDKVAGTNVVLHRR